MPLQLSPLLPRSDYLTLIVLYVSVQGIKKVDVFDHLSVSFEKRYHLALFIASITNVNFEKFYSLFLADLSIDHNYFSSSYSLSEQTCSTPR